MTTRPVLALTGATGFVGQVVLRAALADGWQPRILVRRYPRDALVAGNTIEVISGDLDDAVALGRLVRGATAIVHIAGLIKALRVGDFAAANVGGTERLLQAAASENPSAALVHVSSLVAREPHLSPYAASKRAGEERVAAMAGTRPWLILRPPAIYGPGDQATLPLFKAARLGFLPYPASAGTHLSLLHVADLASAILAASQKLSAGEIPTGLTVEIDDGRPGGYDWPEIISALSQAAERSVHAMRLPRFVLAPIAAATAALSLLRRQAEVLSPAKLAELYHPDWVAAGSGLPASCRWQAGFGLKEGFNDTYRWYRDNSFFT